LRHEKNELKPWRKQMWCIPPEQDAAFVCQMEQVLEVYKRPYDPRRPVICMDEQPKQLISEVKTAVPAAPGQPARIDYEYVREGMCVVWMFVEPLAGWRSVPVTTTKTAVDWAHRVQAIVDDPRCAGAERITLVCDNLNTHELASLYQAFDPAEAMRIARKLELVHTPKHGSWLNVAECELSVLTRQSLDRRLDTQGAVTNEATAWSDDRNERQIGVDWHFTTENARTKLKHLYPKIKT
jgi:DDE superfamily endonuclease